MNKQVAQHENDRLHNQALQEEIYSILCRNGPMTNGQVADEIGISPWKCRPHLDDMKERGQIKYTLLGGRYSV